MTDETNNIFEIIGVYFANCYWNTLYTASLENWREEKFDKKEDAYKTIIQRYSRAFCAPNDKNERINKYYLRIIEDLHKNYKVFLNSSDTLVGFIDVVSKCLLPNDYYKTLSSLDPKKDAIFRKILTKTVMKFTIYISHEEIKNVIDDKLRKNKKIIVEWKKKFIDILTQERNEFCALLMAQNSGINIKNKDEIPQISKDVCDKLQLRIRDLIFEKSELIHERNKLAKYVNVLKKIIRNLEESRSEDEGVDVGDITIDELKNGRKNGIRRGRRRYRRGDVDRDANVDEKENGQEDRSDSGEEDEYHRERSRNTSHERPKRFARRGGRTRAISRNSKLIETPKLSPLTKKPQIPPESFSGKMGDVGANSMSAEKMESPIVATNDQPENEALEALKNEEYSDDDPPLNNKPSNIEEIELPSGDEFKPDE